MIRLIRTLTLCLLVFNASNVFANDLLGALTSQLGITSEQASGGAGALFNMAQDNLSEGEFAQIADVVPGIQDMMSAAQSSTDKSSGVGALTSMLGDKSSAGNMAGLASVFSNLGMDSNMVGQFMPIILDYLQSAGGETVASLMKGALAL
ncbi:MAG: DUF2780 domain-containing protein [Candidatus Thiodiazotropha sp.]